MYRHPEGTSRLVYISGLLLARVYVATGLELGLTQIQLIFLTFYSDYGKLTLCKAELI